MWHVFEFSYKRGSLGTVSVFGFCVCEFFVATWSKRIGEGDYSGMVENFVIPVEGFEECEEDGRWSG